MGTLSDLMARKYVEGNLLASVVLEVTHRCVCDCVHCYLVKEPHDELSLEEIEGLLRQLCAEGTLEVTLTGGEPFLREDLPQILGLLRKDRFQVSLLTTGIPVGKPEAELLKRSRVRLVAMALLGAGPQTHDALMRRPGAFDRTMRAAKALAAAGVLVELRVTLMEQNWRELPAMAKAAQDVGARVRGSITVMPRTDGDPAPLKLALRREALAQVDLSVLRGGVLPGEEEDRGGAILKCYAGLTSAGISPQGDLLPCIVLRRKVGNVRERTVKDIWHDHPDPFLVELRELATEEVRECFACERSSLCTRCPGIAYLLTGQLKTAPPSLCRLAEERSVALGRAGVRSQTTR